MREQDPRTAVYRIQGDRLFVNGAHRGVPVARAPALLAIASGFEGLLSGNRALLLHDFHAHLGGVLGAWRLTLVPRMATLKRVVRAVRVRGRIGRITRIVTHAPDGDFSVLRITP